MKLVFMGTPDFAATVLEGLVSGGFDVCAVFARADKPVGRKQILTAPPAKITAEKYGIPVFQPERLGAEAVGILNGLAPDAIVVAAYGRILPRSVLQIPKFGCVNVHASLLPRHRGASPIQSAIIAGDRFTGITTMLMNEGLDTGDILETVQVEIGTDETAGELFDRLAPIGAELVCHTLRGLTDGTVIPTPQDEAAATYCSMINKDKAAADFKAMSSAELHDLIRGMNPWPSAHTTFDGKRLKLHASRLCADIPPGLPPGQLSVCDQRLLVGTRDGALEITELQLEGGRKMTAADFLAGHRVDGMFLL